MLSRGAGSRIALCSIRATRYLKKIVAESNFC